MRILPAVLALMTLGALPIQVAAESRSDTATHKCGVIADDARRLDCYDSLFRAGAASGLPAAVTSTTAGPPATGDAAAEFGLTEQQMELRKPPEAKEKRLDSIQARVTTAEQDRHGLWRLTLDNGQVWSQTEPALGTRFQSGSLVEIRRGSLGSFVLEVPGRPVIRVRRIR